jgi:hypothetical protein
VPEEGVEARGQRFPRPLAGPFEDNNAVAKAQGDNAVLVPLKRGDEGRGLKFEALLLKAMA